MKIILDVSNHEALAALAVSTTVAFFYKMKSDDLRLQLKSQKEFERARWTNLETHYNVTPK